MRLDIEKDLLLEITQAASKAVSSRSTLPILGGLLFSVKKDSLSAYATDLEMAISRTENIKSDEEEDFVVPSRLFLEIVKNMPEGAVSLTLKKGEHTLLIAGGKANFNIHTLPPEDYPKFPDITNPVDLNIKTSTFLDAIQSVVGSASKDESRPILTGVLISISQGTTKLIATDSYRLASNELNATGGLENDRDIIIPAKTLEALLSQATSKQEIKITLGDNQASFKFGDTTIATKLIGGLFPDYKQLFPEKHEIQATFNKEKLLESLRRVALMAQNNTPLRINLSDSSAKITTQAADIGEAKEEVEVQKSGPDIEIAFNARYLLDGVAGAKENDIEILLSDPLQPGLIKNKSKDGYKYLVMPIRLS